MSADRLRELAQEEPEAFRSVIEKAPEGSLKNRLENILEEEEGGQA